MDIDQPVIDLFNRTAYKRRASSRDCPSTDVSKTLKPQEGIMGKLTQCDGHPNGSHPTDISHQQGTSQGTTGSYCAKEAALALRDKGKAL